MIAYGLLAWFALAVLVALAIGRLIAARNKQIPHDDEHYQ